MLQLFDNRNPSLLGRISYEGLSHRVVLYNVVYQDTYSKAYAKLTFCHGNVGPEIPVKNKASPEHPLPNLQVIYREEF